MEITAFQLAQRFVGVKEFDGHISNPTILAMLKLDQAWPVDDSSTPWCSAFVNYICWLLRLPRSKSLLARSWLGVGTPVNLMNSEKPTAAFDVVVLERPPSPTAGHVGFYAGADNNRVFLLGGNQGNAVSVSAYDVDRVLGIRRLI